MLAFFHVKCYQSWRCFNLLFRMLVDYWGDLLLVGSWMGQSLYMFYWYLFFCARFWVFPWKVRIHVNFRSRGKEVGCHWLFHCLLLQIIFRHWSVERGQQWVWVGSNVRSYNLNFYEVRGGDGYVLSVNVSNKSKRFTLTKLGDAMFESSHVLFWTLVSDHGD